MREVLSGPNAEGVLSVIGGAVILALILGTFLVTWIVVQWRLHRRSEMEAVLKKAMLDRGMPADEIVRVISTPPGLGPCGSWQLPDSSSGSLKANNPSP